MIAKEKLDIKKIIGIIIEKYGPVEKIILFGSQARETADKYSDLDLIIIKKTDKNFIDRLSDFPLLPIHADVFVYTAEEFEIMKENENPFILSALENSKIIYES